MDLLSSASVYDPRNDLARRVRDTVDMDNGGPNHLKAWRLFRGLTQQQLADAIEPTTTKQVIAALESNTMGLSAKWLRRLAPALGTSPGFLLDHDPKDLDPEWTKITADVPPDRRDEAKEHLRILTRRK